MYRSLKSSLDRLFICFFKWMNSAPFIIKNRWVIRLFSYIAFTPEVKVRGVKIKCFIPIDAIGVFDTIRAWETREKMTLDWLDSIGTDDYVIDVGASFGNEYLYLMLKKSRPKKVVSFDIDFRSANYFGLNCKLNNIENNLYFVALTDGSNKFLSFSYAADKFAVKGWDKYERVSCNVPTSTLDEMADIFGVPNYLKIDVDGGELSVLRGASRLLANPRLKSILIEVEKALKKDVFKIITTGNGFKCVGEETLSDQCSNYIFER